MRIMQACASMLCLSVLFIVGGVCSRQDAFAAGSSANCTITGGTLAFGSINVLTGASVNSTATIGVSCKLGGGGRSAYVCLNLDGGTITSSTNRALVNGSNKLLMELYSDPNRTVVFGSSTSPTYGSGGLLVTMPTVAADGTTTANVTVYGGILASQQSIPAGTSGTLYSNDFTQTATSWPDKNPATCNSGGGNTTNAYSLLANATVTPQCSVNSPNTLNFGSVVSLGSAIDAQTTLSVSCSNQLPYTVGLSSASGSSPMNFKMAFGANTLTYAVYQNSARTTGWGNVSGQWVAGTGTASSQSLTVYGRLPIQALPPAGTYTDTISVTVTY